MSTACRNAVIQRALSPSKPSVRMRESVLCMCLYQLARYSSSIAIKSDVTP